VCGNLQYGSTFLHPATAATSPRTAFLLYQSVHHTIKRNFPFGEIALKENKNRTNVTSSERGLFVAVVAKICVIYMSVHYIACTGVEKRTSLAITGVRTPIRPACSQSLYQLRYAGPYRA
jgi:hypothetical protein